MTDRTFINWVVAVGICVLAATNSFQWGLAGVVICALFIWSVEQIRLVLNQIKEELSKLNKK